MVAAVADGMEGAFHLSSDWLEDAAYLISIDNEWSAEVPVSTAAGNAVDISSRTDYLDAAKNTAIQVEISSLKGGHPDVEIKTSVSSPPYQYISN